MSSFSRHQTEVLSGKRKEYGTRELRNTLHAPAPEPSLCLQVYPHLSPLSFSAPAQLGRPTGLQGVDESKNPRWGLCSFLFSLRGGLGGGGTPPKPLTPARAVQSLREAVHQRPRETPGPGALGTVPNNPAARCQRISASEQLPPQGPTPHSARKDPILRRNHPSPFSPPPSSWGAPGYREPGRRLLPAWPRAGVRS